jgi:hypothetical protein
LDQKFLAIFSQDKINATIGAATASFCSPCDFVD